MDGRVDDLAASGAGAVVHGDEHADCGEHRGERLGGPVQALLGRAGPFPAAS